MPKIDPHASWGPLHARAAQETDPRRKTLLQAVGDHMEAEICGRLQPLMDTLTAEPVYHFLEKGARLTLALVMVRFRC